MSSSPMTASLLTSTTDSPLDLTQVFRRAYQPSSSTWRARLGFAYASESGLEVLLDAAEVAGSWDATEKQWLVGIHHAITEPSAIERIRGLPNTEIRLFTNGRNLSQTHLVSGPRFHAKVVCVDYGRAHKTSCLLAGSANLTASALSDSPRNYEAGISLHSAAMAPSLAITFNNWWDQAWGSSVRATDQLLDEYTRLRQAFLRRNPDAMFNLEPPSIRRIQAASVLWIEAGAMSGGSRNQIEFSRDVAAFFGPPRTTRWFPRVAYGGNEWTNRPLSYKVTTFGVEIWRFSLPTEHQCGLRYPGRVVRFRRRSDAAGTYFELDVADLGSNNDLRWRRTSNRQGYVGVTSGDRAFGFN